MKEVKKIKKDVLNDFFEKKSKAGDALHMPSFNHNYMMQYNPKEKAEIENAFSQLVEENIIEERESGVFLTKKGEDLIYPESKLETLNKVKNDIKSLFRESNSDVGHAFNERAFFHGAYMKYNPKEKVLLEEAFQELEKEGIVKLEESKVILTADGVQKIY